MLLFNTIDSGANVVIFSLMMIMADESPVCTVSVGPAFANDVGAKSRRLTFADGSAHLGTPL